MVDVAKFKNAFISEAEDHFQKLNDGLLALERRPADARLLDELTRSAHTVKSSSAIMGYRKMALLTHVMEDVFDGMRAGGIQASPEILDVLFQAVDALERSLASIKSDGAEADVSGESKKLKRLTGVATEGAGRSPKKAAVPAAVPEEPAAGAVSYVKVPVERLDALMNLTEEIMIEKLKWERFKRRDAELDAGIDRMSRLVSSLQYHVMQARLVPLEQITARFPRMVRDLAREQNKDVTLEIYGGDMELDRTIVDKLAEPLMHLLRNAVDHGIEKRGAVRLKAIREKDHAVIIVEDDGRGIDWKEIVEAAVKRKIIDQAAGEAMTTGARGAVVANEAKKLLFHHRLSTKERVTETSGRGVGLSIVKKFADSIGGRVTVESPLPKGGSRFTLELPLTLAIINALLVEIGRSVFAIPFSAIEQSAYVPAADVRSMADQDVAVVRGEEIPLARLDAVFGLTEGSGRRPPAETVVLVRRGNDRAGLVVDRLLDEQEIILKSLPAVLKGVKGFSGSTVLGDGRTVLILDINGLLEDGGRLVRTSYVGAHDGT